MNKMYVITRKDLGAIYKMVQGAHALAHYAIEWRQSYEEWNNEYLIFLEVKDIEELLKAAESLSRKNTQFSIFYEPDIDQVTAIACYDSEDKFKHYKVAT